MLSVDVFISRIVFYSWIRGDKLMPIFITLANLTEKGKGMLADPETFAKYTAGIEQMSAAAGGKLISAYMTMGRYDIVLINEYPTEEVALKMMMLGGARGTGDTETMTAVTLEKAVQIMKG
jgi:uncharacterized protein with GYD domain